MSQQNKSTLQAAINTQLADNTSGDISAADVRDNLINMTDSLVFNEGTGQTITGGLTVTGGITGSLQGTVTTASYAATASFVQTAQTASFVVTAQTSSYVLNSISSSFASTASFVQTAQTASYVLNAVSASRAISASYASTASYFNGTVTSASYASTASYVDPLIQNVTITGSLSTTPFDPLTTFVASDTTRLIKNFTSADCAFNLYSGVGPLNPDIYKYNNYIVLPWDRKIQSYSIYNSIPSGSALSNVISLPPLYNAGYSTGETISVYNLSATNNLIKESGSFYIVASMQGVTGVFGKTINGTSNNAYILSGSWGNYTNISLLDNATTSSIKLNPGQKATFEVIYWGAYFPSPSSSIVGFPEAGYVSNDSNVNPSTATCYYLFKGIENL